MKSKNIIVVIITALMSIVLAIDIYELFTPENKISIAFSIVGTILAIYYGIFGYKKPNGNLMKILFFAYGLFLGLYGIFRAGKYIPTAYCYFVAAVIVVFISGRLDKISRNTYLIIAAFILVINGYVIKCFIRQEPILSAIRLADEVYLLLALFAFYFVRYYDHKKAGITKNKELDNSTNP